MFSHRYAIHIHMNCTPGFVLGVGRAVEDIFFPISQTSHVVLKTTYTPIIQITLQFAPLSIVVIDSCHECVRNLVHV